MARVDYLVICWDKFWGVFADVGSYCIAIASAIVLYFVLAKENRRRAALD